jgi:hypothetical protein
VFTPESALEVLHSKVNAEHNFAPLSRRRFIGVG